MVLVVYLQAFGTFLFIPSRRNGCVLLSFPRPPVVLGAARHPITAEMVVAHAVTQLQFHGAESPRPLDSFECLWPSQIPSYRKSQAFGTYGVILCFLSMEDLRLESFVPIYVSFAILFLVCGRFGSIG